MIKIKFPDGNIKEFKKGTGVITANIDPKISINLRKIFT